MQNQQIGLIESSTSLPLCSKEITGLWEMNSLNNIWDFFRYCARQCTDEGGVLARTPTIKSARVEVSVMKRCVPISRMSSLIYRSRVIKVFRDSWVTFSDCIRYAIWYCDVTESGVNAS